MGTRELCNELAASPYSAATSTMTGAMALAIASTQAANMASRAASSTVQAVSEGNIPSAVYSLGEMTVTTAGAATGLASAAALASVSATLEVTGVATTTAVGAVSGTYDFLASALPGNDGEDEDELSPRLEVGPGAEYQGPDWTGGGVPRGPPLASERELTQATDCVVAAVEARREAAAPRRKVDCAGCAEGLRSWARRRSLRRQRPSGESVEDLNAHAAQGQSTQATQWGELEMQSSRAAVNRHTQEAPWHPTVLLYDASCDPPPFSSAERVPRRAYQMPLNAGQACPIDNDHFEGSFLFLHRTPEETTSAGATVENPYQWHFATKTRRWEARVQGRFRQKPTGKLYTGCVLEDFDYSQEYSWAAAALQTAFVPLLEMVIGERFYFAWGTRGDAADREGAELSTIVTNLAGMDQVVVTPAGQPVPGLDTDISELGFRRNLMSASEYRQSVQNLQDNINTEDTYTLCVWGASKYIDVMHTAFVGVFPGIGPISYAGFLDEWPAHFVLYSLEDDEEDPRHLERKKRYFVDVMVWSSNMSLPKLPSRYSFQDVRRPPAGPVVEPANSPDVPGLSPRQ